MGEFFRGGKRKVGLLTLLMALVAMAGWVRSLSIVDDAQIPIAKHLLIHVLSDDQSVICEKVAIEFRELTWEIFEWNSRSVATNPNGGYAIHWLWKWHGFGVADGIVFADIPPIFTPATIWSFPYWFLTIPLTFMSLWLLLSKPRQSAHQKPRNPSKTSEEGRHHEGVL